MASRRAAPSLSSWSGWKFACPAFSGVAPSFVAPYRVSSAVLGSPPLGCRFLRGCPSPVVVVAAAVVVLFVVVAAPCPPKFDVPLSVGEWK